MTHALSDDHSHGQGRARLLTIHDLQALFRCGRTSAYARVHESDFPAPVALSDSAHRWWEDEVLDWIEQHRLVRPSSERRRPAASLPLDQAIASVEPRPVEIVRRRSSR